MDVKSQASLEVGVEARAGDEDAKKGWWATRNADTKRVAIRRIAMEMPTTKKDKWSNANECVNVNTTDATAGATALLLPAQNTHTLHDPIRDPEHARAGGVEDGLGVGGLDGVN
jgi:hypothetical protein